MGWIRQSASVTGAWHAKRLVSVALATAGVVVLTIAGGACSHANVATHNVAAPRIGGSGDSGCPTQGVGGDSVAPPCLSSSGAFPSGANGMPNASPASGPASSVRTATVPAGQSLTSSSGLGIQGPASVSAPPTPSPAGTGPIGPSSPQEAVAPSAVSPHVTAISPASGAAVGGTRVTITGSGFTGATAVDFGGVSAAITVDSDTEITATSPPGNGTVYVVVVAPNGTSATNSADQFSYLS